jgi:hypothetical protein
MLSLIFGSYREKKKNNIMTIEGELLERWQGEGGKREG